MTLQEASEMLGYGPRIIQGCDGAFLKTECIQAVGKIEVLDHEDNKYIKCQIYFYLKYNNGINLYFETITQARKVELVLRSLFVQGLI